MKLESLAKQSMADLIELIGQMVVESPGLLGSFGVPGFEDVGEGEDDFYE